MEFEGPAGWAVGSAETEGAATESLPGVTVRTANGPDARVRATSRNTMVGRLGSELKDLEERSSRYEFDRNLKRGTWENHVSKLGGRDPVAGRQPQGDSLRPPGRRTVRSDGRTRGQADADSSSRSGYAACYDAGASRTQVQFGCANGSFYGARRDRPMSIATITTAIAAPPARIP